MKIKIIKDFDMAGLNPGCYSFLNLASISSLNTVRSAGVSYYCDGMLLAKLVSLKSSQEVKRVSFDFTSIANSVFSYASNKKLSVFFVGATQTEIEMFVRKIKKSYGDMIIAGFLNGYFDSNALEKTCREVASTKPDIVVVGLGAGKQEDFINELQIFLPNAFLFTCGGFIRQESGKSGSYYPVIINRLRLRAFYRMLNEPHTIKRYLLDYPKNAMKVIFSRDLKIEIK